MADLPESKPDQNHFLDIDKWFKGYERASESWIDGITSLTPRRTRLISKFEETIFQTHFEFSAEHVHAVLGLSGPRFYTERSQKVNYYFLSTDKPKVAKKYIKLKVNSI